MKFSSHLLLLLLGICFASNQAMAKLLSGNENITAVEGTTVQLPCEVDEPDETAIQWSKESENGTIRLFSSTLRQTTDLRYQMNPQTYTLSIENVHKNDSGIFTCDDGETTAVHQLSVTASEVPESPDCNQSDRFEYRIDELEHTHRQGHVEWTNGCSTFGCYYVLLPDNTIQIVNYEVDRNGYRPRVYRVKVYSDEICGQPYVMLLPDQLVRQVPVMIATSVKPYPYQGILVV